MKSNPDFANLLAGRSPIPDAPLHALHAAAVRAGLAARDCGPHDLSALARLVRQHADFLLVSPARPTPPPP